MNHKLSEPNYTTHKHVLARTTTLDDLIARKNALEIQIAEVEKKINHLSKSCVHVWNETLYIPAEPSTNIMINASRDTWMRKCKECGYVQTTEILTSIKDKNTGLLYTEPFWED